MESIEVERARPQAPPETDRPPHRLRMFAATAVGALLADQATKAVVRAWLDEGEVWPAGFELIRFGRVENPGAAFGILQDAGLFLVITPLLAVFAIAAFVLWTPPQSRLYATALGLVLGGAMGNLVDRIARGTVTDFIDPTHYPLFNLADSAVVVGVATLVVLSFLEGDGEEQRDSEERPPGDGKGEAAG